MPVSNQATHNAVAAARRMLDRYVNGWGGSAQEAREAVETIRLGVPFGQAEPLPDDEPAPAAPPKTADVPLGSAPNLREDRCIMLD